MSLVFLEIPHLPTLCRPLHIPQACLPPLFNLVHLVFPLLMQHCHPNLAFKPPTLLPPTSYLLPMHPPHPVMFLAAFLYLLLPLSPKSLKVLQWNSRGLRARSGSELIHFISSHPVDLIGIQKFNLNSSSSFQMLGFSALRSDCTHSQSGILSPEGPHASGGVIILVRQGLSFSKLYTSSLFSLDSYSDYVGVKILPSNSFSLSFLSVYAPLFALLRRIAESTPFFPPFFHPSLISLFWGTSTAVSASETQKVLLTPVLRKYSIGSSLTSFLSMTFTCLVFFIAPLLTSPLLPPLLLLGSASEPGL